MKVLITAATEARILELLSELESLIDADDGDVFMIQHIDMVDEIRERLETSEHIEGEIYVC